MKKSDGEHFLELMKEMMEKIQKMPKEQRDEIGQLLNGELDLSAVENERFYTYQRPDYSKKSTMVFRWLGPFWNAQNGDDKVMLCKFVESDIYMQQLTPEFMREEMRGYLYRLFAAFEPGVSENHWRLYGPLWMMERLQMTGCLDLVLEALRQDSYFFHNYFLHFVEWPSAVVYQLGKDQTDTLETFLYEQGIIPDNKVIVLNALVWVYLRHPEKRLQISAMLVKFLNHCLDICLKGASPMNIEQYAIACATAHIKETMPLLSRLFTELHIPTFLLTNGAMELEQIMNDKKTPYYCKYASMDEYLHDHEELYELDEADWSASDNPYDDDEEEEEDCIYEEAETAKRYIIHIELVDAPEKVERTLQVPSNMYLTPFTELLMRCFDRQDTPDHYEYSDGYMRFLPDADDHALDKDYWEMDGTDYSTVSQLFTKKGEKATFNIKKGKKTLWRHILTLEKSGRYTQKIVNHIELLSGQGTYPQQSCKSMTDHAARFKGGKLKQPDFDAIRQRVRDFEEENEG
jgi:hypothetical protein